MQIVTSLWIAYDSVSFFLNLPNSSAYIEYLFKELEQIKNANPGPLVRTENVF